MQRGQDKVVLNIMPTQDVLLVGGSNQMLRGGQVKSHNDIHEKEQSNSASNYNANISLALLCGDQVKGLGSILLSIPPAYHSNRYDTKMIGGLTNIAYMHPGNKRHLTQQRVLKQWSRSQTTANR